MAEKELAGVMEAIAHIRARSESAGFSPAEVEQAAGAVQRLLLKHNLTLADVERHAVRTRRVVTHERVETYAARWKIDLMFSVAKAHLCKAVRIAGDSGRRNYLYMEVVGHERRHPGLPGAAAYVEISLRRL